MGSTTSALVQAEKGNWAVDHKLGISQDLRKRQLPLIEHFQCQLRLCDVPCKTHGIEYCHFFITDGKWTMEFGGGGGDLSQNTVLVHPNPYRNSAYTVQKEFDMTPEVKERMNTVCGASAYSLCLRNCEHLARYVQSGTWYSLQMTGQSPLRRAFITHMMQTHQALVNTPPQDIKPKAAEGTDAEDCPVYKGWTPPGAVTFHRNLQALTRADKDSRVIIVLGPTGAGKSTLVNLLFNRSICMAKTSPMSVTSHMDILSGSVEIPVGGKKTNQSVRVIDTIGFCDSLIPPAEVVAIVKSFVQTNVLFVDKVVIVCSGRLESAQAVAIKDFMSWLKYRKHQHNFVFIYNKAEDLAEGEKIEAIGTMCSLLDADPNHSLTYAAEDGSQHKVRYAIATGFPPRAPLSEVQPDLRQLYDAVFRFGDQAKPMKVDESWCSIL